MSHKYVYLFSEGNGKMRELLGGKGANLSRNDSAGYASSTASQFLQRPAHNIMRMVVRLMTISKKKFMSI